MALLALRSHKVGLLAPPEAAVPPLIAVCAALATALASILALIWLEKHTLRPLLDLAGAMEQFAAGDQQARSEERGGRELRSMARTFNDMAGELSRIRMRQLRYIAGVVHDLKTPLSAVQVALGQVSSTELSPAEPRLRNLFLVLDKQLSRMASVVGDMLNETKIHTGDLELRLEPVDVGKLTNDVVELFQFLTTTHRINFEAPAEPIELVCDVARLEQILSNLISNAVKFSPAGSSVTVRAARSESGVWLQVSDQGEGIALEQLPRIYEPALQDGERSAGGGLGLFCTKRLVEAHGGRIHLYSRLGGGTSFSVFFPTRRTRSSALLEQPTPQPRTATE
jgi:signal transduction histidine kinase